MEYECNILENQNSNYPLFSTAVDNCRQVFS